MAYLSDTASDRLDLMKKICDFAVLHGWTLLESSASGAGYAQAILEGSGSGSEQIFVGLTQYGDAVNDNFGFYANGYTGYLAGADFWSHPGACATAADLTGSFNLPTVPLWNSGSIPFWLTVSPSLIKCVMKVGTVYEAFYLGFLTRYGTPGQWPYPLCVGTSAVAAFRYSWTGVEHTHFVDPFGNNAAPRPYSTLRVRDAGGAWQAITNDYPGNGDTRRDHAGTWPFNSRGYANLCDALRPALDGSYTLQPVVVTMDGQAGRANAIYGVLDGVRHVAGVGNAAENTITDGGDTYLVVQNCFRVSGRDFWALKLA